MNTILEKKKKKSIYFERRYDEIIINYKITNATSIITTIARNNEEKR